MLLGGLAGAALATAGGLTGAVIHARRKQPKATVFTAKATSYDVNLSDVLRRGIDAFPDFKAAVRGARVLLKPNFVEFHPGRPINTDVRFVAAAAEAMRQLGAATVTVGEGPGHFRDTDYLLEHSGLGALLDDVGVPFVDLNLEPGVPSTLVHNLTKLGELRIAAAVRQADLVVSLAKLKVHHWAGATLTMKNLFGVVPSAIYGWPKNPLHWAGIDRSILDLWSTVRPAFGIVDGIIGMEGDGPIMGTAKPMGVLVMGDNLPAVDATCCRLMGIEPLKVPYLAAASKMGGTIHPSRITERGEEVAPDPFELLPHLQHMRA